jgi:hypothetical protein
MPTWNVYVILKKKEDERNASLLVFICSHGRFIRKRERENICTRHLFEKKKYIYIREKTTCTYIFVILLSRHWCLDIHYHVSTSILLFTWYDHINCKLIKRNFLKNKIFFWIRMLTFYLLNQLQKFIQKLLVVR